MNKVDKLKKEKKKIGTWGYLNPSRIEAVLKFAGKKFSMWDVQREIMLDI